MDEHLDAPRPQLWRALTPTALVAVAMLGTVGMCVGYPCVPTGIRYGMWLDQCPATDLRLSASVEAGKAVSREALIDELLIPDVDTRIFPAISGAVALQESDKEALGILEAFSVTAIIEGADAALKASLVTCFRIHVAMAIGGKGFLMLTGEVSQASPLFSEAIRTSNEEVRQTIITDMRICQEEGSVRQDIPPEEIAEMIWNGWQGAMLQVKVERSAEPLRRFVTSVFKLIKIPESKG